MFEDVRSAAYAIVPEGSLRKVYASIQRALDTQEALARVWSHISPTQAAELPPAKAWAPPIPTSQPAQTAEVPPAKAGVQPPPTRAAEVLLAKAGAPHDWANVKQ